MYAPIVAMHPTAAVLTLNARILPVSCILADLALRGKEDVEQTVALAIERATLGAAKALIANKPKMHLLNNAGQLAITQKWKPEQAVNYAVQEVRMWWDQLVQLVLRSRGAQSC